MELTGREGTQMAGSLLSRLQSQPSADVPRRAEGIARIVTDIMRQNEADVRDGTSLAVSAVLDMQMEAGDSPERILLDGGPTLCELEKAAGRGRTLGFVALNVAAVNEMAGPKERLDPAQVGLLSRMLVRRFRPYAFGELLLFLTRMCAGEYGSFYGSADIMKVGVFAGEYLSRRKDEVARYERERDADIRFRQSSAVPGGRANYIAYMRSAISSSDGIRRDELQAELDRFLEL